MKRLIAFAPLFLLSVNSVFATPTCPASITLSTALASGNYTCNSTVGDIQFTFNQDLLTQYTGVNVNVLGASTPVTNPSTLQLQFSGDSVNVAPITGTFSASATGITALATSLALIQFNVTALNGQGVTQTTLNLNNPTSNTSGALLGDTNILGVEVVCPGGPFSSIVGGTVSAILTAAQTGCSGAQVGATEALNNSLLSSSLNTILGVSGLSAGVNANVTLGSPDPNSIGVIKLQSLSAETTLGTASVGDSSFGDSFTTAPLGLTTPEPTSLTALGLGLIFMAVGLRRLRRKVGGAI